MAKAGKLGIVVGGGPAPGINAVIGAAAIRSLVEGVGVVGIMEGFKHLMNGDTNHVQDLTMNQVSRIHFRGGSYLYTSRANPTTRPEFLQNTVNALVQLGVDKLVTIGGDGTAFLATRIQEVAADLIRVVHVPKTIDNDIGLPATIDTFGFQTARHAGVNLVKNLMVDARTTQRWYLAVTMGRKAGHLALGIGKAAGATLTLIPEEFPDPRLPLKFVVDTLVGAIIKRLADERRDGVAVLAEGLALKIDPADLEGIDGIVSGEFGHPRLAELHFAEILRLEVQKTLKEEFGLEINVVQKDIGYELRCQDPTPFDMEYARDLGYCAAKYLLQGGHSVMVSIQGGHFVPVPFKDLIDPETKRTRVRMVDVNSTSYGIARRYMIRLRKDDFGPGTDLPRLALAAGMSVEDFRTRFKHLVQWEPPSLHLQDPQ